MLTLCFSLVAVIKAQTLCIKVGSDHSGGVGGDQTHLIIIDLI